MFGCGINVPDIITFFPQNIRIIYSTNTSTDKNDKNWTLCDHKNFKKKKDNLSKICESILILFSGKKIHLEQYTVHCNRNEDHTISFKNT